MMVPGETDLAPPAGSDLYYATLYVRPEIREAVAIIEAFRGVIVRIPLTCTDPGVTRLKLAWWRDDVARIGDGKPQHTINRALAPLAAADSELRAALLHAIDAVDEGCSDPGARSARALADAVDRTHGGLWAACARLCGARAPGIITAVRELGCGIESGYALRDLRPMVDAGIVPIAAERLRQHGVDAVSLRDARGGPALGELLHGEIDDRRADIVAALDSLPRAERRAQRVVVTLARIVIAILTEIAHDGYRVFDRRIELTPLSKLWIAWRARFDG